MNLSQQAEIDKCAAESLIVAQGDLAALRNFTARTEIKIANGALIFGRTEESIKCDNTGWVWRHS